MSEFDRVHYYNLLYQDPVAADDYLTAHQTGGMTKSQFAQEYASTVRPGAELAARNAVNTAFVQKHPELINGVSPEKDLENANKLAKILEENNLPYTVDSLESAFNHAKHELTLGAGGETVRSPDGRFVSKNKFLAEAPIEQVREFYESQDPNRRR